MKYYLIDDMRPVSWDHEEGLVEAWDWAKGKMVPDPEMIITVSLGVDSEGNTVDVEEVSKDKFEAAKKKKAPKLTVGGK